MRVIGIRLSIVTLATALILNMVLAVGALVFVHEGCAEEEFGIATVKINNIEIKVEVAIKARAKIMGLMYREEVPDGTGMLFSYKKPKVVTMWMRHTYVPLDVAFIGEDNIIFEILQMAKVDSTVTYSSKEKAKYALEVPLGYFGKNNIEAGDYCEINEINPDETGL